MTASPTLREPSMPMAYVLAQCNTAKERFHAAWSMCRSAAVCAAVLAGLGACASVTAPPPDPEPLLQDALFNAPAQPVDVNGVFALSDRMRVYVRRELAGEVHRNGPQQALVEALYRKGRLKLQYDASMTRNAAETFDARAGNCLSLVIMTATLAKELGLDVEYHSVSDVQTWSRSNGLLLRNGHVDLTVSTRKAEFEEHHYVNPQLVDFLPEVDVANMARVDIPEDTVLAMYMNNKSVEALVDDRIDEAYAWASAALRRAPGFPDTYDTLGVIYTRHGDLAQADKVLTTALARNPRNTRTMSNLAEVLQRLGQVAQASALRADIERLDPHPPFHDFDLGVAAMRQGDFDAARRLFSKELARDEDYHEFHFWLGLAYLRLGRTGDAMEQLEIAQRTSPTRRQRELYAAKLDWLKAHVHTN